MGLHEHWFKPRKLLWGWTPVTWEGWFIVIMTLAIIYFSATRLDDPISYVVTGTALIALIIISEWKSNPRLILK